MPLSLILKRALALRCPLCGRGRMFSGWFRMHAACEHCGAAFDRGPGYYLGSIYFNYGLTALLTVTLYFSLYFLQVASQTTVLWCLMAFCVIFPAWFFRYARSLWFALDQYFDPSPPKQS